MDTPGIAEFYAGRDVLVTGATGFMGKVLVEKLLRSCPYIGNIYIIIRPLKGKTSQQRWDTETLLPCFEILKEQRPDALSKVIVLDGDISKENLGLNKEDQKKLVDNVSIIFHVAASVRFNDPLQVSVKFNTYGTLQLVNIALLMKRLKAFVHVSTAYSNCQRTEVEEKVYPAARPWREVLNVVENIDDTTLTILTSKYLGQLPNTYVFSKCLAENLVWEIRDKLPIIIFRPTIVIASWKEPVPGWIDNFNGPIGLMLASGKGVVRSVLAAENAKPDYTLVDCAIKAMIITAWKRGTKRCCEDRDLIYNCASTHKSITNGELLRLGLEMLEQKPPQKLAWYPKVILRGSVSRYRIDALYKHFLPALIIDLILKILGKKPILLQIQIRVHIAMLALGYFQLRYWKFHNDNFLGLLKEIPPADREAFDFDFLSLDPLDYFNNSAIIGGKKFLFKETEDNPEKARRNYYVLKYTHYALLTFLQCGLLWTLYKLFWPYEYTD